MHITLAPFCNSSTQSLEQAPYKVPFFGGHVDIDRITGMLALKLIQLIAYHVLIPCRSYTDTDQDPYGAHKGLFWKHVGWMLVRPRVRPGQVDIRDLRENKIVKWQHRWYFPLTFVFGILLPCIIPGIIWNDWRGGLYFACFSRITFVHHVSERRRLSISCSPISLSASSL